MIEKNKTYLVTGATGTIGKRLCDKIISLKGNVIALSRNKKELDLLKQKHSNIKTISGDISQYRIVEYAVQNVDGIFHLAALAAGSQSGKALESINTNILGTINILNTSLYQEFDFIVGISSDKAVQISGVYGATKFLNEKLFLEYEQNPDTNTAYRIVRLGNVIYSTDSVLEKWKTLICNGQEVKLSHPDATRYLITVDDAIDIILKSLHHKNATPYYTTMRSTKMKNLLEAMILKYSSTSIPVTITGLSINENKHEKIAKNSITSEYSKHYNIKELRDII
jgi:UDP-N-acetylglucosamine 4,6-dehydratase